MGALQNFVTPLHHNAKRNCVARMVDDKVLCMERARQFGLDYWDGDRRYGYGGYVYIPGYWRAVAQALISTYKLGAGSSVLDVGCGKGFLLHEMLLLEPTLQVTGFDISEYAINSATDLVRPHLFLHQAQSPYPFNDREFDLVISLATLHNLKLPDLQIALTEIERIGKQAYVMLDSYRNERELFGLQCWTLTCESFVSNHPSHL